MGITAEQVLFWMFAVPLIMSAAGVIAARNPVYAAMSLVSAFFWLAGIYVLLTAHLLAFVQIIVYAGAIMVLFLFVVMLLSLTDAELGLEKITALKWVGITGSIGVLVLVVSAFVQSGPRAMKAVGEDFGTVRAVGRILFTQYMLPFEATSVLLLVAIVGAVVVAKEKI
jgi:NADH-quinone oxidoreductase subunit J